MPSTSHITPLINTSYRNKVVEYLIHVLNKHEDEFDTFVMTGYSMSTIGSILAHHYQKDIMIVRKSKSINSDYDIEGLSGAKCVFVDDLICTADTLMRCMEISTVFSKIVGIVTWSDMIPYGPELPYNAQNIPIWFDVNKFEELEKFLKGL